MFTPSSLDSDLDLVDFIDPLIRFRQGNWHVQYNTHSTVRTQ